MKYLAIFLLFSITNAAVVPNNILSQEFIDSINEKQTHWVAGKNFAENTTVEYLHRLAGIKGLHPDKNYKPKILEREVNIEAIPESFDARNQWSYCSSLFRIRNQGGCGSCWVFTNFFYIFSFFI